MQNIGNQILKIRKQKKISQKAIGDALGLGQSAYSKKENGDIQFKADEIVQVAQLLGVAVGDLYEMQSLSEPEIAIYRTSATTRDAMRDRFNDGLNQYRERNKIDSWSEVAEKLHLPVNHMNAVRGGHKDVTIALVANSAKYGDLNANYIVCGKMPIISDSNHSRSEVDGYKKRIEELEKDKEMMQMLLESMRGSHQQTA